jgi:short-subunit dehydrogenase
MKRYDGAVAVVTGASSGIGRRMALDLAGRGATVIGLARRRELLADLERELPPTSPKSRTRPCDVSKSDAFTAVLADVEREHSRIDILINNAAIEQPTPVEATESQMDTYRHLFDTNFFGLAAGTLSVLPGMLERRSGIIVNVSSDTARAPEPRESAYAATKAAVAAFTESVAHEVADRGVHVHVLYPGWVPTAMGMSGLGPDDPLPPKPVRRTEEQVSELVMERMGGGRMEINAAWLPLLGPIGRSLAPRSYQRGMRRFAAR